MKFNIGDRVKYHEDSGTIIDIVLRDNMLHYEVRWDFDPFGGGRNSGRICYDRPSWADRHFDLIGKKWENDIRNL